MKLIVRLFVIALAVTGAIATTSANGSTAKTTAKTTVIAGKTSAQPVPRCPPGDPNGCGITDGW